MSRENVLECPELWKLRQEGEAEEPMPSARSSMESGFQRPSGST